MNPSFTNSDILEVLQEAHLFAQFTDDQLKHLISFSSIETYDDHQTVIAEGARNDKIYILLNGQVSIYADKEFISSLSHQGDLVGEMSVITKSLTSARVVANGPTELFTIPSGKIDQSGNAELKSTVYKLFLDILTEKLTATTRRVIGFQETSEALTEKKEELAKSENVIQQKEAILQQVLGSMSDGVVVMEREGQLLHINNAFREMVGDVEIPEDLNQWPVKLGLYQTDEKTPYTADQLPMNTIFHGRPVDSEEILVLNRRITDAVWLQASSRMLTSANNPVGPQGAVVVFRDFTKKKLEEKALIAAKMNAEATAKAKSDFLAVMSHELRTPLNGIMGMTDLINDTELSEEQKGLLDSLKTSSENLLSLVRNILDFSNLESERLPLKTEPFSLKSCIEEITTIYELHARKKGVSLNIKTTPELPEMLMGNRRGVLQILRNLMDNAIKFTERGEITLSTDLLSNREACAELKISVEDTGIGIDEDRLEDLFEPFSQVDASISRNYDGAGIGLSLCSKYVEKMKGKIEVNSKIGNGSCFSVFLPFEEVTISATATQPIDGESVPADKGFAGKFPLNILVAEDNAQNQKLILKVLEKLGYEPEIAGNGLEAVERNRAFTFDLVLMDLHMPEMGGLEAAKIITQEKSINGLPSIIALTANVSEEVRESCMAVGMKDYITKPLKIDQLVKMLQKLP